jgi:hypothetical protein
MNPTTKAALEVASRNVFPNEPHTHTEEQAFIEGAEWILKHLSEQAPEVREWWIKDHRSGRNISNQLDLFTAVVDKPQNPGWTHVVEHSSLVAVRAKCELAERELSDGNEVFSVLNKRIAELEAKIAVAVELLRKIHDGTYRYYEQWDGDIRTPSHFDVLEGYFKEIEGMK